MEITIFREKYYKSTFQGQKRVMLKNHKNFGVSSVKKSWCKLFGVKVMIIMVNWVQSTDIFFALQIILDPHPHPQNRSGRPTCNTVACVSVLSINV